MTATVEEQREVIRHALDDWYTRDPHAQHYQWGRAKRMLNAGAYLDAVLVMMPEGWLWSVGEQNTHSYTGPLAYLWTPDGKQDGIISERAATPALALLETIQKAYEHE